MTNEKKAKYGTSKFTPEIRKNTPELKYSRGKILEKLNTPEEKPLFPTTMQAVEANIEVVPIAPS